MDVTGGIRIGERRAYDTGLRLPAGTAIAREAERIVMTWMWESTVLMYRHLDEAERSRLWPSSTQGCRKNSAGQYKKAKTEQKIFLSGMLLSFTVTRSGVWRKQAPDRLHVKIKSKQATEQLVPSWSQNTMTHDDS